MKTILNFCFLLSAVCSAWSANWTNYPAVTTPAATDTLLIGTTTTNKQWSVANLLTMTETNATRAATTLTISTSNNLVTVIQTSTNGLASTNYVNSTASTVSNALAALVAVKQTTNAALDLLSLTAATNPMPAHTFMSLSAGGVPQFTNVFAGLFTFLGTNRFTSATATNEMSAGWQQISSALNTNYQDHRSIVLIGPSNYIVAGTVTVSNNAVRATNATLGVSSAGAFYSILSEFGSPQARPVAQRVDYNYGGVAGLIPRYMNLPFSPAGDQWRYHYTVGNLGYFGAGSGDASSQNEVVWGWKQSSDYTLKFMGLTQAGGNTNATIEADGFYFPSNALPYAKFTDNMTNGTYAMFQSSNAWILAYKTNGLAKTTNLSLFFGLQ